MLSYARGHVHVGELVIDIAAEGALVALPTVALLGAYLRAADDEVARDALALLATLDGVAVLPLGPAEADLVAATVPLAGGDIVRAHALWAALRYHAYYFTTEPQAAPSALAAWQVHPIPVEDA